MFIDTVDKFLDYIYNSELNNIILINMFESNRNDNLDGAKETEVSRSGTSFRMAALGVLLAALTVSCGKADNATVNQLSSEVNSLRAKVDELEKKHSDEAVKAGVQSSESSAKKIAGDVCSEQIKAARSSLAAEAQTAIANAIAKEKEPCGVLDQSSVELAVHNAVDKILGADSKEVVFKKLLSDVLVLFVNQATTESDFSVAELADEEIKATLLTLIKNNPDKIGYYLEQTIATINALPEAKRVDVAIAFGKVAKDVMSDMTLYVRFGSVVGHHDEYEFVNSHEHLMELVETRMDELESASVTDAATKAVEDFRALTDEQQQALVAKKVCNDTAALHDEYENLPAGQKVTLRMINSLSKNGVGLAQIGQLISSTLKALVQ